MAKTLYYIIISIHTLVVLAASISGHIANGCNTGRFECELDYYVWLQFSAVLFITGIITWVIAHATVILMRYYLKFSVTKILILQALIFLGTIFLFVAPRLFLERNWDLV